MLRSHGLIFVLSAPSGGGKSSLAHELVRQQEGKLIYPISVTTRPIRAGEVNNKDYHFISPADFEQLIKTEQLIEYAVVFGNQYGVTTSAVQHSLQDGKDIILTIDWQGMLKLKELFSHSIVTIYILPPSLHTLANRLTKRADKVQDIEFRMSKALTEISQHHLYDYLLINDDFQQTLTELTSIITASRHRIRFLDLLPQFIANLT